MRPISLMQRTSQTGHGDTVGTNDVANDTVSRGTGGEGGGENDRVAHLGEG